MRIAGADKEGFVSLYKLGPVEEAGTPKRQLGVVMAG